MCYIEDLEIAAELATTARDMLIGLKEKARHATLAADLKVVSHMFQGLDESLKWWMPTFSALYIRDRFVEVSSTGHEELKTMCEQLKQLRVMSGKLCFSTLDKWYIGAPEMESTVGGIGTQIAVGGTGRFCSHQPPGSTYSTS